MEFNGQTMTVFSEFETVPAEAVLYTAQALTESQMKQARENIGAAGKEEINGIAKYMPLWEQGYIGSSGENANNTNYRRTDFIPVDEYGDYTVKRFATNTEGYYWVLYDGDKSYLTRYLVNNEPLLKSCLEKKENAKYVRLTQKLAVYTEPSYLVGKTETEKRLSNLENSVVHNALFGKKYVAAGDSYTAWSDAHYIGGEYDGQNVTYDREIRLRNKMTGYNDGLSGSTMAILNESATLKEEKDPEAFSNTRYLNIPEDTDILTIAFGINDRSVCNLGQLGDTENTTFYGAWDKVLKYYAENRPAMKIGIICFHRQGNADFYNALKEIAKYYGVPLLDFYGGEDTPMYVDGKAYSVDATIQAAKKAYWGGHAHTEAAEESFRGKTYKLKVGEANLGHPGYRTHIDEATIIEAFLLKL